MRISVLGAGAFGTALAITLVRAGRDVTLWGRDVVDMAAQRENARRLPGQALPNALRITGDLVEACRAPIVLMALPAQQIDAFARAHGALLTGRSLVACCKGIDMRQLKGPVALLSAAVPDATHAILTGPSFAADLARGLPTALTLACADRAAGKTLQAQLATPNLRLYLSTDTAGAELGGAMKNVIAIGCGAVMGAGWGDSARSALMTRGFAEMQRIAPMLGAREDTLVGLSGLGDLALTCGSDLSRNYRFGHALGQGHVPDIGATVEGAATASALVDMAGKAGIELPISEVVARLAAREISVGEAQDALMGRSLKEE